jgi:HPr kinase/phosphorylase
MANAVHTDVMRHEVLHATTVSIDGKGVMIIGPSGSGKSALALELMAFGAGLVADDRTIVKRFGHALQASVPDTIQGKIEARGIGILNVPVAAPTALVLVVDLGRKSRERVPEKQSHDILGVTLDCLHNVTQTHL